MLYQFKHTKKKNQFQYSEAYRYNGICLCICVCVYIHAEMYQYKDESKKDNGRIFLKVRTMCMSWLSVMPRGLFCLLESISPPVPVEASQVSDVLSIIERLPEHFFLWLLLLWISLMASLVSQVTGIFRNCVCLLMKVRDQVLCRTPTLTTWEVHWEPRTCIKIFWALTL